MKLFLTISLLGILIVLACNARNVDLGWNQPDEQAGQVPPITWNVFRKAEACEGVGSFTKINPSNVLTKTYTDLDVPYGILAYQVTAQIEVAGEVFESGPSNCASVTVTPNSPTDLTLTLALAGNRQDTNCEMLVAGIWESSNSHKPFDIPAAKTQLGSACNPFMAVMPERK